MTIARQELVDRSVSGFYHCISRCVRRAHLCADDAPGTDPRKLTILSRLRHLAELFAIDVGGYAIMDNHFHIVMRTDPSRG